MHKSKKQPRDKPLRRKPSEKNETNHNVDMDEISIFFKNRRKNNIYKNINATKPIIKNNKKEMNKNP